MFGVLQLLILPRLPRPFSAVGNSGSENNSLVTYFSCAYLCYLVCTGNWTQYRITWEESLIGWSFGSGWFVCISVEDIILAVLPEVGRYSLKVSGTIHWVWVLDILRLEQLGLHACISLLLCDVTSSSNSCLTSPQWWAVTGKCEPNELFLFQSRFFGGVLSQQQKQNQDTCHLKNCV